jgi:hypothetical protein
MNGALFLSVLYTQWACCLGTFIYTNKSCNYAGFWCIIIITTEYQYTEYFGVTAVLHSYTVWPRMTYTKSWQYCSQWILMRDVCVCAMLVLPVLAMQMEGIKVKSVL